MEFEIWQIPVGMFVIATVGLYLYQLYYVISTCLSFLCKKYGYHRRKVRILQLVGYFFVFLLSCVPLVGAGVVVSEIDEKYLQRSWTERDFYYNRHSENQEVKDAVKKIKLNLLRNMVLFLPVAMLGLLWLV